MTHNDDTLALQCGLHELDGVQSHQMLQRLHSLCILQGEGGGGGRGFQGVLKFLEQKKGGYENCLNISWGDAYFL